MPYLYLFLSSFLAATIVPFSSEGHLYYLLKNNYDPFFLLAVASVGNTMGGLTSYFLGRICKWGWLNKYFGIKEQRVKSYQQVIWKHGYLMAIWCWLPLVGDVIAVALGFFKIPWRKVLLLMFIGKFLRYLFVVLLP